MTAEYTISMLGPSRVGKTSLVASIFEGAQEKLLAGKPFLIKPTNTPTEKKLATHARELRSSIMMGDFQSGAVAGTQESFEFKFEFKPVDSGQSIFDFNIIDFPGGWIDKVSRSDDAAANWKKLEGQITNSDVLIVPVEAGVLMESKTKEQKGAIEYNLQVGEICDVVKEWAKKRKQHLGNVPSAIIFSAVKCESYFKDNAVRSNKDRSGELYDLFQEVYKDVVDVAQRELGDNPNLKIHYTAVDTIGNVRLSSGRWQKDSDYLRFSGRYHITGKELQPKGAEDVFILICQTMVAAQEYHEAMIARKAENAANNASHQAQQAHERAEADRGFLGNIGRWFMGDDDELRKEARAIAGQANELSYEAKLKAQCLQQTRSIVAGISEQSLSGRHKRISG